MEKNIPSTDFQPLKKFKTKNVKNITVEKKKYLDIFFSEEWKNQYFVGETPKPP